ncbi:hypothetical protein FQN55_002286 [Onygenales sp. PD_40]|nr:hypothetical protein FQN55_002286 [Onygenales sp. PD_40]KAK2786658.1 hypothetical protein FQN53_006362 [Emmonsiellopsis sp. PD_33]
MPPTPQTNAFMDLPTELHAHIATYLSYPDALALKHTNTYFYALVRTGLGLKVNWILERCKLKLRVPFNSCEFRTDQTFCNSEIREIMEKRRRHQESIIVAMMVCFIAIMWLPASRILFAEHLPGVVKIQVNAT